MQMNHRKNENIRAVDAVKQAVGEPAWNASSDVAVDDLILVRIFVNFLEEGIHLV